MPGHDRVVRDLAMSHAKARKTVEHSMLVVTFHVIDQRVPYADLGADCLQKRQLEIHARQLAHEIEARLPGDPRSGRSRLR